MCKKKKFKCNGKQPCELCVKKRYECTYTGIDRRSLKAERMLQEKMKMQGTFSSVFSAAAAAPATSTSTSTSTPTTTPTTATTATTSPTPAPSLRLPSLRPAVPVPAPAGPPGSGCKYVVSSKGVFSYLGDTSSEEFCDEVRHIQALFDTPHTHRLPVLSTYHKFEFDAAMELMKLPEKDKIPPLVVTFRQFLASKKSLMSFIGVEGVIDLIYDQGSQNPVQFAILYMIMVFSEFEPANTEAYFKSAVILLRNNTDYNESLELIQAHSLVAFHFRALNHHRECYYHLGIAINIAKLLDLFRSGDSMVKTLFDALALNDSMSSILVGRPPHFSSLVLVNMNGGDMLELTKILNRICTQIYLNCSDSSYCQYSDISILLKSWAIKFTSENPDVLMSHDSIKKCMTNLFSILLLCRPLFMFHILKRSRPEFQNPSCARFTVLFFTAAVEASICMIELFKQNKMQPRLLAGSVGTTMIVQSALTLYLALIFIEYYNDLELKSQFNLDYLAHCIATVTPALPHDYRPALKSFLLSRDIKPFTEIDLSRIANFQVNFVNQEMAPVILNTNNYNLHDSLVLRRVQPPI